MEIADTAFSTVLLLSLAVIFATFKFIQNIHVYILLILIDLCIDYKRGGKVLEAKEIEGLIQSLLKLMKEIPFQVKELLLIS